MQRFTYSLDNLEITCCSQVVDPATEMQTEYFSSVSHFSVDESQCHISGVAVLADTPLLRLNRETGEKYEVVFTKEVCTYLCKQIFSRGLPFSLDHNGVQQPAVLIGCFQTSPLLSYQSAPEGSIVVTFETTPEIISLCKDRSGFSVELTYDSLIPLPVSDEPDTFDKVILNNIF